MRWEHARWSCRSVTCLPCQRACPEHEYRFLRSIGQEDVDDAITRDLHRTFPEHPFFSTPEGQAALFRVLKAYSVQDLEVRRKGDGEGEEGRGGEGNRMKGDVGGRRR